MQAGRLRHSVTITEPVVTGQNGLGEDEVTWQQVGDGAFPCLIQPLQGIELQDASQRWARAKSKITMRHQPGIAFTAKMRVQWGSIVMDILDVRDMQGSMRPEVVLTVQDHEGIATGVAE